MAQSSITDYVVNTDPNAWQSVKKRKIGSSPESPEGKNNSHSRKLVSTSIRMKNRFQILQDTDSETNNHSNSSQLKEATENSNKLTVKKEPSPPPIFIQEVTNYTAMCKDIATYIDKANFTAKSLSSKDVKINVSNSSDFRKLVSELRDKNISFYTYQLKVDRAFKVVIRNLHFSIDPSDIKAALESEGHNVRNVFNIRHWKTKEPLPLFFIDLEPDASNKSIYDLKVLLNTRVKVEAPKPRREPIQCKRCQRYGHTKSYCKSPYICVKCGGNHDNRECTKAPETKPLCGLCGGDHTANYRGCPKYKAFAKITSKENNNHQKNRSNVFHSSKLTQRTYAETTSTSSKPQTAPVNEVPNRTMEHRAEASTHSYSNRLEQLLEEVIKQNQIILDLLAKVVSKLMC